MSETARFYFEQLLDDRWTERIDGRVEPVPKPHIKIAVSESDTRLDQYSGDIIFIRDGGSQGIEPKSLGWQHEGIEEMTTIDIRTTRGHSRLVGVRDENNESERYGGLRGEVKRILDTVRTGDREYDWIDGYEWNVLSEEVGFQFWRGTWDIRLTQIANEINPET